MPMTASCLVGTLGVSTVVDVGGTMLDTSDVIAFAATTDLARARTFYESALGLRVVEEYPFACVFDANGTMLRVTAVAEVAQPGYRVLGWRVESIRETSHRTT